MCKMRFGSHGVILDGFKQTKIETRPPPLMAKVMKNFHFFLGHSLSVTLFLTLAIFVAAMMNFGLL